MTLSRSFLEVLESFRAEGVRYLIIGGYAVIFHGYSRMTKDLDLWVDPEEKNANAVVKALKECRYGVSPVVEMQLRSPNQLVILGETPNRIDLITGVQQFDFAEQYRERRIAVFQGVELSLVSLFGLRKLKEAAGRLQDRLDLDKLPVE